MAIWMVFGATGIFCESAQDLLLQAQMQYQQQHLPEAANLARAALNVDHTLADAHTLLGLIAAQQGQQGDAEQEFKTAIVSQPRNYRLLGYLGGIYMQQSRFSEAGAMFRKAVRLNPNDLAAHYNLGLASLATSNGLGAAEEFSFVARRSSKDVPARIGLLESRLLLKDRPGAAATLGELDKLMPPDDPDRSRIAALLASSGCGDLALPMLERIVRQHPADWSSVYNLVLLYQQEGRLDQAATLLLPFGEGAHKAEAADLLGSIDAARGRQAESLAAYRTAATLEPTDEGYRFDYCNALLQSGEVGLAEESFREAVQKLPSSWKLRAGLGVAEFLLGTFQDSAEALLAAVRLNPTAPVIYDLLDRVYDAAPSSQEAIRAAFKSYIATNPPGAKAYAGYGRMLFAARPSGDATARNLVLKAIRLDPSCAEAYTALAAMAQAESRAPEALSWYEKAARADPNSAQAHYRLAQAYQRSGFPEKAKQELAAFSKLKAEDVQHERRDLLQLLR